MVFPEPGAVELRTEPLPEAGLGEVVLRTRLTLMSTGTEGIVFARNFADGTHWSDWVRYPFRPGYACIGEVEHTCGELAAGDRVAARAPHASRLVIAADECTPVPRDLTDEQAVWFALAKIAFVGIREGAVRPGDRVLIAGAGPIGQMATRWAAAAAASRVVVVDTLTERLGLALAGGATAAIAGTIDGVRDELSQAFGGQAPDIVIDSTGNPAVLPGALRAAADRGRVVLLGDAGSPSEQRLTSDVITRGVTIRGAHDAYTVGDPRWDRDREINRLFFRLAGSGRFPLGGLVSHRFDPREAREAYELATAERHKTMGIVFDWTS
jgi:2-desacetyl-2-hydroxyethyl bacteriochlorophyllide A dehydrogenase